MVSGTLGSVGHGAAEIAATWSGYGKLIEQRLFKLTAHPFVPS
jgi:hypothetical protein